MSWQQEPLVMIKYPAPSRASKYIKGIFILEAAFLFSSYFLWKTLNASRDTRFYFYKNHRFLLSAYYKIGEFADSNYRGREADYEYWLKTGKITNGFS